MVRIFQFYNTTPDPAVKPPDALTCVIFDIDGTLARTNTLIFESFNHLAQKYLGRRWSPAEIVALFGPPEEGALAKVFGEERVGGLMEELLSFYRANHRRLASLHHGIDVILRELKSRSVRLAVFTGKGKQTTAITLGIFGLTDLFDLVVTGNDVVNHKPHPEGIQKVLATFDLSPGSVLMVGDSLTDLRASRAAGVRSATVLWDSFDHSRVLAERPDLIFHTVEALADWLRSHVN